MQLPSIQSTQSAWYGYQLKNNSERWVIHLTPNEVDELDTAATRCLVQNDDVAMIDKSNFVLDELGPKLALLRQELIHGLGFMLIKGIDRSKFTTLQLAAIFYGFGSHIGNARMQNAEGHVLGHVRDLSLHSDDLNVRIYQTNERQTFHTDSADVVALICLNKAMFGGDSLLVSAVTVFNEMRENCPELLQCLFDPISTDRRGETPDGMDPYFSIPVFTWFKNNLNVIYQRQYIDSAQRFDGAFKLTEKHVEALNKFDELCNDPSINLSMQLEPGDMQFVYNHSLLHDRTEFVDNYDREKRRHLLRLWLSIPDDRELPVVFKQRYETIDVGARGGISLPDVKPCAPLQAG